MRILIRTSVAQAPDTVFEGFDQSLFLRLAPPFPPVKLLRFDGCQQGDRVVLELNMLLFKNLWESLITESHSEQGKKHFFIDEGIKLPFFLKTWHHTHLIESDGRGGSSITDEIRFTSPFLLSNYLLYPTLYLQFLYRKPIYKKIFAASAHPKKAGL